MSTSSALRSPTNLVIIGVLALLAIVGWVLYGSARSDQDALQTRLDQRQAEMAGQIEQLQASLDAERAAAGDLESLKANIASTNATLSDKMAALGERERDLAEAQAAADDASAQLAALEQRYTEASQRLNHRLQVLGERERDLAAIERALSHGQLRQEQVEAQTKQLGEVLSKERAGLEALRVEMADLARQRSKSAGALEQTQAQLEAAKARLAELEQRIDKALLAEGVAELKTKRADLEDQVTALNAEIEHKQPLLGRSVSLSQELIDLDEQERTLAEQRDRLTAELAKLVLALRAAEARRAAGGESNVARAGAD